MKIMPAKKKTEFSIEKALSRLDEISDRLENDLPLEEALTLYGEGVSLIKDAEKYLTEAEKKIHVLTSEEIAKEEENADQ